jgi:hypothetical protein
MLHEDGHAMLHIGRCFNQIRFNKQGIGRLLRGAENAKKSRCTKGKRVNIDFE